MKKKKEEQIVFRIDKEQKAYLQKMAKKKGISLSHLIYEYLSEHYHSDLNQIRRLIKKKKEERSLLWEALGKSKIINEFEEHIAVLYTEFINPASGDPDELSAHLLSFVTDIIRETIKHFGLVDEQYKNKVAYNFIRTAEILAEGLVNLKSADPDTKKDLIKMKADIADQFAYHLTASAFAKESYMIIKREIEEVKDTLLRELKKETGEEKIIGEITEEEIL